MTDNKIIKALECCLCSDEYGRHDCCECSIECGVFETVDDCILTLRNATIDLINRQKAEIDTLKAERNNYKEWYLSLVNERNKYPCKTVVGNNSEIHSKTAKDYDNLIADIKSEAIKEFVERLKKLATVEHLSLDGRELICVEDIDNLVKEMTGGKRQCVRFYFVGKTFEEIGT